MKKYFLTIAIAFVMFSVYGCYTQVDFRNRQQDDYGYSNDQNQEDNYSENDSDTYSDGGSDVTINNYNDGYFPGYRRYLWHNYYPSFSVGFSYGPYWDPFYYDPWYYGYYPGIPVIAYYSPYYYDNYYDGGYYNNSYWNGGSVYKERTTSAYRLRNNDGGRGNSTVRDRGTRDLIQTSLNRDRQRTETLKRDVNRITRESSPVLRNRDNNNAGSERTIIPSDRPTRGAGVNDAGRNNRNADQPSGRNREIIRRDKNSSNPNSDEIKSTPPPQRGSDSRNVDREKRKTESASPSRTNTGERKKGNRSSYSSPRRESSQPRYEAPRSSNSGSSRSSSPSSSRSSGSSSGGSRDRRR
ncbi:MAG: hypothetical protein WCS69_12065 [Ignavibacteriaceae bacterium]|jgi:hypothetical protein